MPHIRIAITLLCAVLLAVACSAVYVHRTLTNLSALTEAALNAGQTAPAVEALHDEWENAVPKLRMLLPNTLLSDINEAISRLEPGNCRSELMSIAADLRWLDRKQVLCPI
jgi:hypothetical protein